MSIKSESCEYEWKFKQKCLLFFFSPPSPPPMRHKQSVNQQRIAPVFLSVGASPSSAKANTVWIKKNFTNVIAGSMPASVSSWYIMQSNHKDAVPHAHKQKLQVPEGVILPSSHSTEWQHAHSFKSNQKFVAGSAWVTSSSCGSWNTNLRIC